jgi:hypothetical protein
MLNLEPKLIEEIWNFVNSEIPCMYETLVDYL